MIYRSPKTKSGLFTWILVALLGVTSLLVLGLTVWTVWGRSSLHYELTPSHVVIAFGPTVVEIARDEITELTLIERPTRARRLVGSAMPGLYQGLWSFEETGRIVLYATQRQPLVVIETADGKWGINPEDPESFVAAVERGATGTFEPVGASAAGGYVIMFAGVALILGTTFGVGMYLGRLSGGIRYELGPDSLRIYGSWRPVDIPYRDIKSVAIENPGGIPARMWGVAMPGLYWGVFAWKAVGPGLRLCATRLKPLVVIRTGQRTYGLSPEDDAGFVEQLQRRIRR